MKTKMIISVCLLLASIAVVQAASVLPQGRWTIAQVTIEKNTDGNIQTTVYNTAADVKSYIPCPQELEINAQSVILRYPDGTEETTQYTLEDNQLTILIADAIQSCQYSIKDGNLTLTAKHNYVNNLPTGHKERIAEQWIISLKKQK